LIDHLYVTYVNITTIDLENNFEQMRKAWDPRQPVETLLKQIQDCDDFLGRARRNTYWPSAANQCGLYQYFCHMQLHERLSQMEREGLCEQEVGKLQGTLRCSSPSAQSDAGGSSSNSGYHATHAAVGQTEDPIAEEASVALTNMATSTATERDVVASLNEENSRLAKTS
jgi:hypothetical protein